MGFALAVEARSRGADVTLVMGPTALQPPPAIRCLPVVSANEMAETIEATLAAETYDAVVMAAAVGDYRPLAPSSTKLKKDALGEVMAIELTRTKDILAGLAQSRPRPFLVGFAAETTSQLDRLGWEKLSKKGCDLLVANDVTAEGAGFGVATNRAVFFDRTGDRQELPIMGKRTLAARIWDRVEELVGWRSR
jgi:phosphopantothenoylcysteine decarboxylase/phosphopantothenate--cysteine ligase